MASDERGHARRAPIFLGVDGGGTKTAYCLIDATGELVAEDRDGASIYPIPGGPELVTRALAEGVGELCDAAGITPADIAHAFFGIPTYGESSAMIAGLDAAPRAVLGHDRYACGNDMVPGWAGSLAGRDGINVVCGTGSMTYGERDGVGARVGGWGEVFGDEGSAYWIAVRGLNAYSRMSDGREPRGPLVELIVDYLGLPAELDLVEVVLERWGADRARIASLSQVVAEAARRGDARAIEIFGDAAEELAELVVATWRRLGGDPTETTLVSYSGGVFAAQELITEPFRAALHRRAATLQLRRPRLEPLVGAALQAARLHGTPLHDDAIARLEAHTASKEAIDDIA